MKEPGISRPVARRTRAWGLIAALAWAFVGLMPAARAADADIFTGEAPVANQDEAERTRALAPALVSALVKASGDSRVADDPRLAQVLDRAPQWLASTSYRQDAVTGMDGLQTTRTLLVANFMPAGIAEALGLLGRGVWGERPRTLVWLVIDDGNNKRIASAQQVAALTAFTSKARERGVSAVFPQMDAEDLGRIDAETLWSGNAESALAAAQRYANTALVARLRRNGAGWTGQFSLLDAGPPAQWAASNMDASAVLAAAAAGLADRLAERYTVAPGDRVVGDYRVWVSEINGANDYGAALAYLQGLSVVDAAVPEGAAGTRMLVKLTLNVRLERMRQILTLGNVLAYDDAAPADGAQATFRLLH